jgi:hypothetical protein
MTPLAILISAIFLSLAAVHVYWALGGRRGVDVVIPEMDGRPLFRPGVGGTLVIAALLAVAAALVLERAAIVPGMSPTIVRRWGAWAVAAALVARALGDFNYVGFFKRRRTTAFARWDTRLYSPLALALGLGVGLVAWGGR